MNVGALLEELRENLLRDVSDAVGGGGELFSDKALVRYLDDAHQKAARLTKCLRDSIDPELTRVVMLDGIGVYQLDNRVIDVISVELGERFNYRVIEQVGSVQASPRGRHVTHYSLDAGDNFLRLFATPGADYDGQELYLTVARMPLNTFSVDDLEMEPEIPADYHLDLVEWAAFRALRNHDVDAEAIPKANIHRSAFREAMDDLARETRRKYFGAVVYSARVNN